MDKINDEIIMAYVDGELDEDQAAMVKKALETDAGLRQKAALFQDTGSMLQGLYDAPLNEPVPARLLNTVRTFQPTTLPARITAWFRNCMGAPVLRPALATASIILLFVGVAMISRLTIPDLTGNNGYPALLTSDEFNRILETTPSGEAVLVERPATEVIPITTFQDKSCRFCRQFEISAIKNSQALSQGIACRNPDKKWATVAFIEPQKPAQQPAENAFELAAAGEPIDNLANRLRIGPLLTAEQESDFMRQGWEIKEKSEKPPLQK